MSKRIREKEEEEQGKEQEEPEEKESEASLVSDNIAVKNIEKKNNLTREAVQGKGVENACDEEARKTKAD